MYTYKPKENKIDPQTDLVKNIFIENKRAYGTRRIKAECARKNVCISRRRIARIMTKEGLVSSYTKARFKTQKQTCNEAVIENIVDRKFHDRSKLEVVVSDLTYVRVGKSWHYICTLLDLHNREITGYSVGANKDAKLVTKAFANVKRDLRGICIFHTDRGKEFDNQLIDDMLATFHVKRSLSRKGTPYDNAVAEATYKIIKTEFVYQHVFKTQEELLTKFQAFVWWYNNKRLHSTLGYIPPVEYESCVK